MKKLNIGIFKVLSLAVGLAVGLVLIAKISFESSQPYARSRLLLSPTGDSPGDVWYQGILHLIDG